MTPEAACFLLAARECLLKAHEMLDQWPDEAGRAAYVAALQAARGLIFERTGAVVTRHAAVQAQFGRLVAQDPNGGAGACLFLGRAYNFRFVAEEEAGPGGLAPDRAAAAVEEAERTVAYVTTLLAA
ncbi:HEPN domain-containing protein [Rhodopila globiformis]|uniref:HEPN domain-containing protein n=1 Tax=Rhodopila globiformis TaxID=1071 RepID=A0A2S6NPC0_RHOGL|nr:HEPN domain-containing protein [Rhodopila globiformis]PPQ40819.1 hypothetical protein CCS01_00295 [Rhodopila globiformis]